MDEKRVFISSALNDRNLRRVAAEAIRSVPGFEPVLSEESSVSGERISEAVERDISESDLFVGIISPHSGYSSPERVRSSTEVEFEAAARQGKPVLLFVQQDPSPPKYPHGLVTDLLVRHLVPREFSSLDDLKSAISKSLAMFNSDVLDSTFEIVFDPELSNAEVATAFGALSDYFRACGGQGFRAEFERQEADVRELLHV